jgi:hypothetical protein
MKTQGSELFYEKDGNRQDAELHDELLRGIDPVDLANLLVRHNHKFRESIDIPARLMEELGISRDQALKAYAKARRNFV